MLRETFAKTPSWQVTAIICTAILAPSAIYAASTFSNVDVINPTTGTAARIDAAGNVHVLDVNTQYRDNPLDAVDIRIPMGTSLGCSPAVYTIPSGKALVVTAISGNYYNANALGYSGFYVYSSASCSGEAYIDEYVALASVTGPAEKSYSFGNGIPFPAGSISLFSDNDAGFTDLHGFLVPAADVLASSFQSPAHAPAGLPKPGGSSR